MRASRALFALLAAGLLAGCASPTGDDLTATTSTAPPTTTPPSQSPGTKAPPPTQATHTDNGQGSGPEACQDVTKADLPLADPSNTVVGISTTKGCIVLELNDAQAPVTVANFKAYAEEGFYAGTLFHRITRGFMIQGGGMDTEGNFKSPTHPAIQNEARSSGLKNVPYSIAMARQTGPDTATNQFFVNHAENDFLDPGQDASDPSQAGYAVFGMVIQGRDVVDAIASTAVTLYNAPGANPHCQPEQRPSCPTTDIVIQSVRVL